MPEQETELRTLEAAEDMAPEGDSHQEKGKGASPQAEPDGEMVSRAELEKLKADYEQLKSGTGPACWTGWRGMQAEFENARKRAERERQEFRDFAVGNVVEQFLPVVDNFELALKATGSADRLRSGVELIVKQMEEILRQLQVQPIADGRRGVRSAASRGAGHGGARRHARSACGRRSAPRLQAARAAAAAGTGARGVESETDE